MAHNPGFLKLVNDAKARVKQTDIEGYKKMVEAGLPHVLVDTREESEWAAGQMGYTNAISLDGGWKALKESGLQLEK